MSVCVFWERDPLEVAQGAAEHRLPLPCGASIAIRGPSCGSPSSLLAWWSSCPPPTAPLSSPHAALARAPPGCPLAFAVLLGGSELWWGRDALGARSLLVGTHAPSSSLVLCRVAPAELAAPESGWAWSEVPPHCLWRVSLASWPIGEPQEVPCELHVEPLLQPNCALSRRHAAVYGIRDRDTISPPVGAVVGATEEGAARLRISLEAALRRTLCPELLDPEEPVMVLYSGGLDSSALAALANVVLPPQTPIELVNVSFAEGAFETAPDRVAAANGILDLRRIAPQRDWRFVRVNVTMDEVGEVVQHVMCLSFPQSTIMDATIAVATWFAARGRGKLNEIDGEDYQCRSKKIILGQGSDEQFAGYTRHRKAFVAGQWERLEEELERDNGRLWLRNMGRDDRVLMECEREPVLPFLEPEFVQEVNRIPLWNICNFALPPGRGDKQILRMVASSLGLTFASTLQKRAMQFGTRIAKLFKEGLSGNQTRGCGTLPFQCTVFAKSNDQDD